MATSCQTCAFSDHGGAYEGVCRLTGKYEGGRVCAKYQPDPVYIANLQAEQEEKARSQRIAEEEAAEKRRLNQEAVLRAEVEKSQKNEENKSDLITGAAVLIGGATFLLARHSQKKSKQGDESEQSVSEQRSALKRSKWVAAFLAIFLGWAGAQKFYLKRPKQGVILLAISLVGSLVLVGPIITAVIGIIEGIEYLTLSPEKFQETYVTGNKIWF